MDEISGHKKALLIQLCKSSDPEIVKYGVPVLSGLWASADHHFLIQNDQEELDTKSYIKMEGDKFYLYDFDEIDPDKYKIEVFADGTAVKAKFGLGFISILWCYDLGRKWSENGKKRDFSDLMHFSLARYIHNKRK